MFCGAAVCLALSAAAACATGLLLLLLLLRARTARPRPNAADRSTEVAAHRIMPGRGTADSIRASAAQVRRWLGAAAPLPAHACIACYYCYWSPLLL